MSNEIRKFTDPYEKLEYAVGTADTFQCFDFAELPDGRIALHSVSVILKRDAPASDNRYEIVNKGCAPAMAMEMVIEVLEKSKVRHDRVGWDQDPYYFVRAVMNHCGDSKIKRPRFGRKPKVPDAIPY